MKTKLFVTLLSFMTINLFPQITVTDNDIIDSGDVIYEALDSVSGSSTQIGSVGAGQTWDFSSLQQNQVRTIEYLDPSLTPFASIHPTSNICTNEDGEYQYFKKSSTSVEIVGLDDQEVLSPVVILPLPLIYPMQFSTGQVSVVDESVENSFVPDSQAPFITFGAAHTVDSVNIQLIVETDFDVDGYGDVILPMGTFPALRLSVVNTNIQNVYLYCTDTILGIGSGWYSAPQQVFPSGVETDYAFQWWSNDPLVKFALVNIEVDEFGNNNGDIQFLTNNMTLIDETNDLYFNIFPVPATYNLTIESLENKMTDLILRDVNGKLVLDKQFNTSTVLSLDDIARGPYYLTLKTENRLITKKIIID
jgi:hypothetical protein